MKKEQGMSYIKKDLLLITGLTFFIVAFMMMLFYFETTQGTVGGWASTFYYHLVRL